MDQLKDPELDWMKDKFSRIIMSTFHDGNITLHDKDDVIDHDSCNIFYLNFRQGL